MRIDVITIFGEYLAPLRESLLGKAIATGLLQLGVHDLRDSTTDRHRTVDDSPYGGGPGMVMKPDVWGAAIDEVAGFGPAVGGTDAVADRSDPGVGPEPGRPAADSDRPGDRGARSEPPTLIVPTPAGRQFTQSTAAELAAADQLIFACGRYEGIDQRVIDEAATRMPVRELSIGDYVLAGGEAAVLVMVEAIARLLPGVLGNPDSAVHDSFGEALPGLVEAPTYTRPVDYRGHRVPEVLLGGNHAAIDRHRRDESLRRTAAHRPDLLAALTSDDLDERDYEVLLEIGAQPPPGLAERIEQQRTLRAAKRAKRSRKPRTVE